MPNSSNIPTFVLQKKIPMKLNKKPFIITISLVVLVCLTIFMRHAIIQGENNIRQKVAIALQNAITQDFYQRFFDELKCAPQPLNRKVKGTKVITKNKIETIIFKDSIEEHLADQLINQYLLAQFKPINPHTFNAIFQKELAQYNIKDKTGIIYRYKGKPQYSGNDSILPQSALYSRIKMLDIKNTVSIQAWVDYSWKTLFNNCDIKNIRIVVFSILILFIVFLFFKKKEKNPTIINNDENCICIAGIKMDLNKKLMYINDRECPIRKMEFDLIYLFLNSPDYFLSRETINQKFWPNEDYSNITNRINTHINHIKNTLKDFPGYEVMTIRGEGYQITVPSQYAFHPLAKLSKLIL